MSRIVVALGGNALIRRGEPGTIVVQRHNLEAAAVALVDLVEDGHELVVTHGNGPQVGFLAIEAEVAADVVPAPPLDVLGAESQGQIGYLVAQALRDALLDRGLAREVAVLLTRTEVDPADPAFQHPTKFLGPIYDHAEALRVQDERGWAIARDGVAWRRVVASPRPVRIVEAAAISHLVRAGVLVIASGGGGVPVVRTPTGRLRGVEAVVDKDLAAVELALTVDADALLLLTDVDAVYRSHGSAAASPLRALTTQEARAGLASGTYPAGSMGPKVEAAVRFAEATGRTAAIGSLRDARGVFGGSSGTRIMPSPRGPAVTLGARERVLRPGADRVPRHTLPLDGGAADDNPAVLPNARPALRHRVDR